MTAPAVNHADGVARLMGDTVLFARVLARFRQEYEHAGKRIHDALAAGDLQLAQRLAHTLKGAAGMIEAVPLREEAHALERALRDGSASLDAHLARLERLLGQVMRELNAADGAVQHAAPRPEPQRADADALPRLRTLLADGNGDAVDLVQDAAASLTKELGEDRYRLVAAAIEVFDFEGALALLNRSG